MPNPYQNRLDAGEYEDDVQCKLRLEPHPRDESGQRAIEGWISDRLLARLSCLARAYELPLLARLPATGLVTYPQVQLSSIEDELELLFKVVSDNVLLDALAPMREMIQRATRDPRGWSLIAEAP